MSPLALIEQAVSKYRFDVAGMRLFRSVITPPRQTNARNLLKSALAEMPVTMPLSLSPNPMLTTSPSSVPRSCMPATLVQRKA